MNVLLRKIANMSLAIKLSTGFVVIGIFGAILVAVLSLRQTTRAFDRFVLAVDQDVLATELAAGYALHGSWDFLDMPVNNGAQRMPPDMLVVLDNDKRIVTGFGGLRDGMPMPNLKTTEWTPVMVNGEQVGFITMRGEGRFSPRPNPERLFLLSVTRASVISALAASTVALVLGIVVSGRLMRPVRELTAATQTIADGQFGAQVVVNSQDEIGRLAQSFNKMSSDLAAASHSRKQMTADIAHDLRTPLTILRGYTEGLQDGTLKPNESLFSIMHEEVVHLEHLVSDLRTLSLADAGELSLNRRAVVPKALLERTGLKYVMQAEQQGVRLHVDSAENLPPITVDSERMTQVLNNLVSNALRHTKQGEIMLAATQDAATKQIVLQVSDTGSGIAPGDLSHIFKRFYRADKSRQREGRSASSGLGLAIANAIVKAHGGTLSVQSQPQQGTTFSISLPSASKSD